MLITLSVGNVWATDDALDQSFTGITGTSYTAWSGKTGTSGAVYAGNSAGGNSSIQLRSSNNNSGVVTTTSGGMAKKVVVVWNSNTSSGRTLTVYGKNSAYSAATDLYDNSKQGTSLGTIVCGTSTELNITGDYEYIGFRSNSGAMYLTSVTITWEAPTVVKTLQSVAVSGTPAKTEYYDGQDFNPEGLTVTGTYSDNSTATITSGITWSYETSVALELNQTSIKVKATVSNIASAWFTVSGLTVTDAPAAEMFEKLTAAPEDWSGEYLIVYENGAKAHVWTGIDAVSCYVEADIDDNMIAKPEGAVSVTIAAMDGGYSVLLNGGTNNGKYIQNNGNSNGIKFADAAAATTLTYENNAVTITCGGKNFRYNNASGNDRFRYFGSDQQVIQLYKKSDGSTQKDNAELAFATANYMVKLGVLFTAPTITNPHSLSVTYASSNTDVATVNPSTGAVTINAAGKAEITASSAETETYKAGSAKYTICVTEHEGTAADPYSVVDAKLVIDAIETKEGAYVTGVVSVITTAYNSQYGNISFDFSVDGTTSGQQLRAYRCKGLDNAALTSENDVVTGATVVVYGNLKKYNSTYELDEGCYLASYEAPETPKTPIANTKATAYTVAQALVYANDALTYDLNDDVYIKGIVYQVNSFNESNGTYNIYIRDEGKTEEDGKFEFFKCAGLYNESQSQTVKFAEGDVQVGDEVIGYGKMTYYNNGANSIWEFATGNYLVDLVRPEVAVTSVTFENNTLTIEAGETATLTATVLPDNASNKNVTWSVVSGSSYASVADGVVTAIAAGEAVIRATSVADEEKYAECTVTVTAGDTRNRIAKTSFDAISGQMNNDISFEALKGEGTAVPNIPSQKSSILLYQPGSGKATGGYISISAVAGCKIDQVKITAAENATTVAYSADGGEVSEGTDVAKDGEFATPRSLDASVVNIYCKGASNQNRLYVASLTVYYTGEAVRALQSIELSGNYPTEFAVGDAFSHQGLVVTAHYTIGEDANVTAQAVVSEPAMNMRGNKTVTVSYTEEDITKTATYSVSVTSDVVLNKEPVAVVATYGGKHYAMSNTIESSTAQAVEVTFNNEGAVEVADEDAKAAITWYMSDVTDGITLQDASDKYLTGAAGNTGLSLAASECTWEADENGYYSIGGTRTILYADGTGFKNYAVSNISGNGYSGVVEFVPVVIAAPAPATYTVTFAPNGGTFTTETVTSDEEGKVILPADKPVRDGYYFMGWKDAGNNMHQAGAELTVSADITLTAQWEELAMYERTVTAGNFGTICLANPVYEGCMENAEVYKVVSRTEDNLGIILEQVTAMEAGMPYLFIGKTATLRFYHSVEHASAALDYHGLHGTIEGLFGDDAIVGAGYFVLQNNLLRETTSGAIAIGTNRAYLVISEVPAYGAADPSQAAGVRCRVIGMEQGTNTATGCDELLGSEAQVTKVLRNGVLYIIRADRTYNAQGQLVK